MLTRKRRGSFLNHDIFESQFSNLLIENGQNYAIAARLSSQVSSDNGQMEDKKLASWVIDRDLGLASELKKSATWLPVAA